MRGGRCYAPAAERAARHATRAAAAGAALAVGRPPRSLRPRGTRDTVGDVTRHPRARFRRRLAIVLLAVVAAAVAPASASAAPAASGNWSPGAGDDLLLDLDLASGGPVLAGRIDFPSPVLAARIATGPPGSRCAPAPGQPTQLRCAFGPAGWMAEVPLEVQVTLPTAPAPAARLPWRLSEDGTEDTAQPALTRKTGGRERLR
jgi:hypothetical protein